jgi:hypothetical protein
MKLFGLKDGIAGPNQEIIRNAGWLYQTEVSLPEVVLLHIPGTTEIWGHISTFNNWHTCFNCSCADLLRRDCFSKRLIAIDTAL